MELAKAHLQGAQEHEDTLAHLREEIEACKIQISDLGLFVRQSRDRRDCGAVANGVILASLQSNLHRQPLTVVVAALGQIRSAQPSDELKQRLDDLQEEMGYVRDISQFFIAATN